MNRRYALLVAAAAAVLPHAAPAATTCTSSNVSLSFGPYLAINAAPTDAQASLVVTCTRTIAPPADVGGAKVTVSVWLGPSQGSNSIQNRQMFQSGGSLLNYNVYLDSGRIAVWGNTDGVDTATQTLNVPNKGAASATFTFYGRIFPGQNVPAGPYSDSLLVTVNY